MTYNDFFKRNFIIMDFFIRTLKIYTDYVRTKNWWKLKLQ